MRFVDRTGYRYGRLTIIERAPNKRGVCWVCQCDCGKIGIVSGGALMSGHTHSCGCIRSERARKMCQAKRLPSRTTAKGYVMVYAPEHPNANKHNKTVLEHVLVMSEHLGRPLFPDERVHHMNGIRNDNRIENLELWTVSHPAGQRVEDMLQWAHQMIERYKI